MSKEIWFIAQDADVVQLTIAACGKGDLLPNRTTYCLIRKNLKVSSEKFRDVQLELCGYSIESFESLVSTPGQSLQSPLGFVFLANLRGQDIFKNFFKKLENNLFDNWRKRGSPLVIFHFASDSHIQGKFAINLKDINLGKKVFEATISLATDSKTASELIAKVSRCPNN
jgi:hypothetical protein